MHLGDRQAAAQRAGDLEPVRRGAPGADDAHRLPRPRARPGHRACAAPPAGPRGRAAAPGTRRWQRHSGHEPGRARPRPRRAARRSRRSGAGCRPTRRHRAGPRRAARARARARSRCLNSIWSRPAMRGDQAVRRRHASHALTTAPRSRPAWRSTRRGRRGEPGSRATRDRARRDRCRGGGADGPCRRAAAPGLTPPPRVGCVVEAQARGDVDVLGADDVGRRRGRRRCGRRGGCGCGRGPRASGGRRARRAGAGRSG